MRYIRQSRTGGYPLFKAHANPPKTPTDATRQWKKFRRANGYLLEQLKSEQYGLCCYSEIRAHDVGYGFHIEHIENKSQNPSRTFDYSNLAASAFSSDSLQQYKAAVVFGGHAKGKQNACNMTLFISCYQPDCARYFSYLSDGRVVPNMALTEDEKTRADYTINTLNLNSNILISRRRSCLDELDKLWSEHIASGYDLELLAAVTLTPSSNKLYPFFSASRQFFGNIAESALKNYAPGLV